MDSALRQHHHEAGVSFLFFCFFLTPTLIGI
jgi:hypothetical protein